MKIDPIGWTGRGANGFKEWLRDLNRESFQSFVTQCLWAYGSIKFTNVAVRLMLDEGPRSESHYSWGFQIIAVLLGGWGVKTIAGVVSDQGKRKTNVPYVEARERGQAAAAAAAAAIESAKKERATKPRTGHRAVVAEHADRVEVHDDDEDEEQP